MKNNDTKWKLEEIDVLPENDEIDDNEEDSIKK